MFPTQAFADEVTRQRWAPDPETVAALKYVIRELTLPESDGLCKIERVLLTCQHANQRDEEIRTAGFAILGKRFKDRAVFFHVDCSDEGLCSFALRLARHSHELHSKQPAKDTWFANLLKPREEWVTAPTKTRRAPAAVSRRPAPQPDPPKPPKAKMRRS